MPLSRFCVQCCRKADEDGTPGPARTSGHALAIPRDRQRRLYADIEIIWHANVIMLDESKTTEIGIFTGDVWRFLRLTEEEADR
ncbi:MAG: hypothetical protein OXQ84_21740 [bacterium]|nr:hypothetical protein [bacterium]